MASCLQAQSLGACVLPGDKRALFRTPSQRRTSPAVLPELSARLCCTGSALGCAPKKGTSQERRGTLCVTAAKGKKGTPSPPPGEESSEPELSTEERLLALEAKFGRGGKTPLSTLNPPPSPEASPEPAKPVVTIDLPAPVKAFLEYWLNPKQGGLVTLNDLAYKAIFVLGGAWVVFRFIGPLTGLYDLEDPLIPRS